MGWLPRSSVLLGISEGAYILLREVLLDFSKSAGSSLIGGGTQRSWGTHILQSLCGGNIQYYGHNDEKLRTEQIGGKRTIVSPNERVTVTVRDPPICMLLSLLQCNVHIPIETGQNAWSEVGQRCK